MKIAPYVILHFVHFVMTALAPSLRNGQSGVVYFRSALSMSASKSLAIWLVTVATGP
jgi:hypothetical protein